MAQPSGQVLLDSGGTFYGYFWYANATGTPGLWDARDGVMATKTGSGGVATEGGATVAVSSGSTYYTLAAPLTLSGDFTIGFKVRLTASGSNAIVLGDRSGISNFVGGNAGGSNLRLRANGIDSDSASGNLTTTMATMYCTRSSGTVTLYKDGTSLGSLGANSGTLTVAQLMDGYNSGALAMDGAAEFFHIIVGTALNGTQIASLSTDPYQVLVGGSGGGSSLLGQPCL